MTLLELQKVLGDQIEILTDKREPYENKKRAADVAVVVSSLAKQMINNADVVLRAEKLFSDSKLNNSAILDMVSGKCKLLHETPEGAMIEKF